MLAGFLSLLKQLPNKRCNTKPWHVNHLINFSGKFHSTQNSVGWKPHLSHVTLPTKKLTGQQEKK